MKPNYHPFSLPSMKIRSLTTLLAAGVLTLSACTSAPIESSSEALSSEAPSSEVEAVDTPPAETVAQETAVEAAENAAETTVIATGTFEGRSDHVVSGSVELVESGGRYFINLADDFSLDGAPDPKVGLGSDGYDPATKAGHLEFLTGASSYEVGAGIDVLAYNEVYIWCERFSVPLGLAQLQFQ